MNDDPKQADGRAKQSAETKPADVETAELESRARRSPAVRPLAFTILLIYGLLSFLLGYREYSQNHVLPPWASITMILAGVLLGSTAIRVLMGRYRAFGRAALGLAALLVANCFGTLVPGLARGWREPLIRAGLSALILVLVRFSDRAIPVPRPQKPGSEKTGDSSEPPAIRS